MNSTLLLQLYGMTVLKQSSIMNFKAVLKPSTVLVRPL